MESIERIERTEGDILIQVQRLDLRLGKGVGATKERTKLQKELIKLRSSDNLNNSDQNGKSKKIEKIT